ncbi:MAG: ArsB/NhaD family transporter [Phycisphaerae bacterium]|nr:ArsB/NhaD family transporter [Phycisphaerae bacterium]
MSAILTAAIFIAVYVIIATEKINKTIIAVIGASLMIALHLVTFENAVAAIDLNVIFLLVGMMTAVSILAKTGFFEWVATSIAKKTGGNPILIMISLLLLTAFFSAVLDNVTTIILLVPVTILIAQILEISPVPIVIMEVIASNIGGTSTLIGDPPNIVIGSQANLSFNQFLIHLGPVCAVIMGVMCLSAWFMFKKQWRVPAEIKNRVTESIPHLAIVDKDNMIKALIIIGFILIAFFLHSFIGLEPGIIALGGSMILIILCKTKVDNALLKVEWGVIFFFIGLFMMIAALEQNGILLMLAKGMFYLGGNNLLLMCIVILWGSAIFSAVLDNIPFVITMVPMIKYLIPSIAAAAGVSDPAAIQTTIAQPMWWALALGACLGGNGTLIGASANVVMSHICERNKYPISFMRFSRYGVFFMTQSMIICTIYLWLRYF